MVALHYWSFELFPLNELYRGKACALKNSYTLGDILMILSIRGMIRKFAEKCY